MRLHFLLHLVPQLALASVQCYAPDGTPLAPEDAHLPCVSTLNITSMCCVLNVTALVALGESAANIDTCLPNGLCQNSPSYYSRNFCTDKTWKSPNCLKVCTGNASGGSASSYSTMTNCIDGTWCCGSSNETDCCDKNLGFQLAPSIAPYAATSTTVTTTTATLSASSPSTPVNTNGPSSANGVNGLGIGLGVALGVVLLADVVVGIVLYRRHRARRGGHIQQSGTYKENGQFLPDSIIHEAPAQMRPVELDI